MIRINLLAVERGSAQEARGVVIPAAHRVTIGASLILLAHASLGIGWWFWSLRQQSAQLDEDIARAEAETQQLRSVLAQVQKFEARKAQLQQRVTLIEQLRRGQSGAGARARRDQQGAARSAVADRAEAEGRRLHARRHDDVADRRSRTSSRTSRRRKWFKRPVEIIDSQVQTRREDRRPGQVLGQGRRSTTRRRRRRRRRRRGRGGRGRAGGADESDEVAREREPAR